MPWALFPYGRSKPPRTRLRRVLWACAVFVFCAALAQFVGEVAAVECVVALGAAVSFAVHATSFTAVARGSRPA